MEDKLFKDILKQVPFGYAYYRLLTDAEGKPEDYIFLHVNSSYERMTGLKSEDILGKRFTDVLPSIRTSSFDWLAFYGEVALTCEKKEISQYVDFLGGWYRITAFAPKKGYFVTVFQEITEEMEQIKILKAQKQHIKELTEELKTVLNSTQDAMFLIKVENDKLYYMRNNVAHQKLTGLSMEHIKNKTPVELLGSELGKTVEANYRRCLEAGTIITYEETLNLPGGVRTWQTSLNPVFEGKRLKYIVGSSKDITLQKKAEAQLENMLKYEKIISNVSRLALLERNLERFLTQSLQLMGEEIGVSRAYLFKSDSEKGTMSNTFEWTASNVMPQKENLQEIPETEFAWWMEKLKNKEVINYKDIEDIPDDRTKEILRRQEIKSLLVLPVYVDGRYYGFIGFDDCLKNREWTESDINLLKVAAEVISQFILLQEKEEKLWSENQRFKALVDSTEDAIFELDREQCCVAVYGKWMKRTGLKPEFFLGKTPREIFGLRVGYIHEEANRKALAGQSTVYEWSIKIKGKQKLYQTSISPIKDRAGLVLGTVAVGRDITELMMAQQELRKERELLRTTLLSIGDGVVTTNRQCKITSVNKIAEELSGWKEEEVKGKDFSQVFKLISEETGEQVEDPVARVLRTGKTISLGNHTALITKGGSLLPIADSAAPIKDEKGQIFGVVMVLHDVTKIKKQQERILYLSYRDPLTGLYNRRFMEEKIKRLDNSGILPVTIIMGDLNGLKLVNDVFGHEEGDRLLKKAANLMREGCRKEDIIARWGGDEFLILLTRTDAKAAEAIIERIKNRCLKGSCKSTKVSIALGYAVKSKASESLVQTLKEAEEWMYRRKLLEGKSYRNAIINTMISTLFAKSMEIEEHAERLKNHCLTLGKELRLSSKEMDELALLAVLHDIGKVAINENILKKPGPLTDEEWEEMKKHPEIGYRIARNTPELAGVAEYILSHHECWDGTGYPRGIKGKEIPLLCRILAVVDSYDAMTTDRCYHKSISSKEAIEEIKRNSGTQFDPRVADVFCRIIKGMETSREH